VGRDKIGVRGRKTRLCGTGGSPATDQGCFAVKNKVEEKKGKSTASLGGKLV